MHFNSMPRVKFHTSHFGLFVTNLYDILTLPYTGRGIASQQDGGTSEANVELSVKCWRFAQGYYREISRNSGKDFQIPRAFTHGWP